MHNVEKKEKHHQLMLVRVLHYCNSELGIVKTASKILYSNSKTLKIKAGTKLPYRI
jgi:hypothetical protein